MQLWEIKKITDKMRNSASNEMHKKRASSDYKME